MQTFKFSTSVPSSLLTYVKYLKRDHLASSVKFLEPSSLFKPSSFFIQASFKNGNLFLKWKYTSCEDAVFILSYRHENDEMSHIVDLNSECKIVNMVEYRVEYTIPCIKPGRYICQMQSKCHFGVSEMSDEISFWNDEEVSFVYCLF